MNVNQPKVSLVLKKDEAGCLSGAELVYSDVSIPIRKGDRIIQMSLFRADTDRIIQVVDELAESARAAQGFGSSGR
jgi:dUTPase